MPVLVGTATGPVCEAVVHHSIRGNFAIREGPWTLELVQSFRRLGKGGVTDPPGQLYGTSKNVGEQMNEYNAHPEILARLSKLALEWKAPLPDQPDPSCVNKTSLTKGTASLKCKKE